MTDKCLRIVMAGMIVAALLTALQVAIKAETAADAPIGAQGAMVPSQEGMSALATKVLRRIVEALAAIHSGETQRAEGALHEALALVERIKAMRPSTRIADHSWYEQQTDLTRLCPSYAECSTRISGHHSSFFAPGQRRRDRPDDTTREALLG